jgi:predicted dehydrogenase
MRVGVIGCGTVSEPYLRNMTASPALQVVACSDLAMERAVARAAQFGIPGVCTRAELLADPSIDLVVNLTVPRAHFEVTMAALQAGKHVWTEKPLAMDRTEAAALLRVAAERDVRIGCAPDTVLGAGIQTSRKLLDEGAIGRPLAGAAFFMSPGPESWHPDPVFLYQPGAGPLFDVGVYYVTALVNLLGPVASVSAFGRVLYPERVIGSGPRAGESFLVGTDTYVAAILRFENEALVNLIATFGVWGAELPRVQVYGGDGVLDVPDPNTFGGPVRLNRHGEEGGLREVPLAYDHTAGCRNCRGLGAIELAEAVREGREPRASGAIAYHVLDVMQSVVEASKEGRQVEVESTCERPAPMPLGTALAEGELR